MSPRPDDKRLRAEARVGRVLRDKWRLDRVLGVGGSGSVYAATHRAGKQVAVKLLHPELSVDEGICARFLREAYVANTVAHPGAVSVLDNDISEDGTAFLVMDLLQGETLKARVERTRANLECLTVLAIADQVLDVLGAAHDKGIIHRDIKPENLFLTREGQIKLLDFGIARFHEVSLGSPTTQTGSPMGTPAFMPPEQSAGRWDRVDARSDLWSLGATMFTLLTGRLVHGELTPAEALVASITKPVPRISSLLPELPQPAAAVVDRALAFEREKRWLDARAMQQAVREAYHAASGNPLMPPQITLSPASTELLAPARPSDPGRSLLRSASPLRRALWIAAGLIASTSLVLTVGLFGRRAPPAPPREVAAPAAASTEASPIETARPIETAAAEPPAPTSAIASAAKPQPQPGPSAAPISGKRPSSPRQGAAPAPAKSAPDPFSRRR